MGDSNQTAEPNKPASDILERTLKTFRSVLDFGLRVSLKLNGRSTTVPGEMASIVHTKMCVNAASAGYLCEVPLFDHSAIMTVCRMCVDGMTLYFYLNESVSADEWECRELVLRIHDTTSRIRLMRATQDKTQYQDLLDGRKSLKADLEKNSCFKSLAPEIQTRLLSGREIFVGGMHAAAVRAVGWREEQFQALYNYLSQHVHSAPMAFLRVRKHNVSFSDPSDAQRNMVALALNIAEYSVLRVSMHCLAVDSEMKNQFDQTELTEFQKELDGSTILNG